MSDHVGVFIDGRYLLRSGVKTLVRDGVPKVIPHRFNVLSFKNAVVSVVERLVPKSRILRIYWYECEAEEPDLEYRRRVILAKNGVKLRTFSHEKDETAIATATRDRICDDVQKLSANGAITDAVVVSEDVEFEDLIDEVQALGIHVHMVEIQRRELYLTLDLRMKVDTFSPWTTDSLRSFLLPNDGNVREDQDRILDPREYDIPESPAVEAGEEESSQPLIYEMQQDAVATPAEHWADDDDIEDFQAESDAFVQVPLETADISPYVREYVEKMLDHQIRACVQYWGVGRRDVPTTHDKSVLAACREGIQRNLTPDERKVMRDEFMRIVNQLFVQRGLEVGSTRPDPRSSSPASRFQVGGDRFAARPAAGGGFSGTAPNETEEVAQTEITEYVEIFVAELNDDELQTCLEYWESGQYGVPSMFDKGVMAMCRQELGRNLGEQEKYYMRSEFKRITNEISTERGVS